MAPRLKRQECTECAGAGRREGCPSCGRKRAYFPWSATPAERFWGRVKKIEGGCWLWLGAKTKNGYGNFSPVTGTFVYAHQYSYALANGGVCESIGAAMRVVVMHLCDNKLCVNPEHLRVNTQQENIVDMFQKERKPGVLALEMVAEVRRLAQHGMSNKAIAEYLHLSRERVYRITSGRSWANVKA